MITITEDTAAQEIITIGREVYGKNLVSARGGNLSIRLDGDLFMITGQGAPLGFLSNDDLVIADLDGQKRRGRGDLSFETGLHAAIYNNLSSRAIVHVHPAFTLTLTDSACDLKPITLEAAIFLGTVPIIPQEAPNVTDTASVVASFTLNNIVILKNHGIVSVGETIWDAFFLAELLEEASHMTILSYLLAGVKRKREKAAVPKQLKAKPVKIFSKEHVSRLIKITNSNKKLQTLGKETHFSLSLGLRMQDQGVAYTLVFKDGKIVETKQGENKDTLVMAGSRAAWCAICNGIMDPFAASIQKKMEFGASIRDLSPWYPFFRSLFALWQTIPVTEGLAAIKI